MKSFVVCSLLIAFLAASTQAGSVRSRSSVQYSCDLKGIAALAEGLVAETAAVVLEVKADIQDLSTGVLSCVSKDLTNPETLVNCVVDFVQAKVQEAIKTVENYVVDLKNSVQEIKVKLEQCSKL